MPDEFKEQTKIVYSNLGDSGNSNGGVGARKGVNMEEENSEIGSRKRRLREGGENSVGRDNGRSEVEKGTVFSKECEETFKSKPGANKYCNPCGLMRKKLIIKKKVLKDSKRRKLNRPM